MNKDTLKLEVHGEYPDEDTPTIYEVEPNNLKNILIWLRLNSIPIFFNSHQKEKITCIVHATPETGKIIRNKLYII